MADFGTGISEALPSPRDKCLLLIIGMHAPSTLFFPDDGGIRTRAHQARKWTFY